MNDKLPPELSDGALLRDAEYAWELSAFPTALCIAPSLGYACLGGQLWFLLPDKSVYELYWLESNASDRLSGENWDEYSRRSCDEVLASFNNLVNGTDFAEESKKFGSLQPPFRTLFNAYFVTESECLALGLNR